MLEQKRRRMLALDLDGTTFGTGTELSDANRKGLEQARELGTVICFITGRKRLDPILHIGDLADYFVLNNGGTVIAMPEKEQLYTTLVDRGAMLRLIDFCNGAEDVILHMHSEGYWGVNRMSEELMRLRRRYGVDPVLYHSADDLPFTDSDGFVVSGNIGRVRTFIEEEKLGLSCAVSDPLTMDVMPGGVNKWRGASYVAEREGIPAADIISAGNYYNDLELIRGAGIGVAVRNAPEDVRTQADYVTEHTHMEDAVAELIDRFLLNQGSL